MLGGRHDAADDDEGDEVGQVEGPAAKFVSIAGKEDDVAETDADHDRMSTVMKRQADGAWEAVGALLELQNGELRDPQAPPEVAGLLGCGVMAGLGAALNTGAVGRGDSVAVIGCGGVEKVFEVKLNDASRSVAAAVTPAGEQALSEHVAALLERA